MSDKRVKWVVPGAPFSKGKPVRGSEKKTRAQRSSKSNGAEWFYIVHRHIYIYVCFKSAVTLEVY